MTSPKLTLLELVQTVSDYATNDDEIMATVVYLINSGKVQLSGNFAGARIDLLGLGFHNIPHSSLSHCAVQSRTC